MKVLITTDWYKPQVNGVVRSIENLYNGLRAAGNEVKILTLAQSGQSKVEGDIYSLSSIAFGKIYPNARVRLIQESWVIDELIKWKPDVIHSQCEFSTFLIARRVARICGVPLVHTYHTVYEDYTHYFCPSKALGHKITETLSRLVLNRADSVIVPSEKVSRLLKSYRVEPAVHVIPTGLTFEKYLTDRETNRTEIREKLNIGKDEFLLIYVGRIAKEKNIEEIIHMLHRLGHGQRLLIVGDGPYMNAVRTFAEREGVTDRIIYTGMVSPKEVHKYYCAGDAFVNASQSETQGLTYMEAMAASLAVLCKKDDALKGLINSGENGCLYETDEEFISTVNALRENAELRRTMGEKARAAVLEEYSVEQFAVSCMRVYRQCILDYMSRDIHMSPLARIRMRRPA